MKKLFAMLMVLVMGLSLVACGGQESEPPAEGSKEPAAAAEGSVYWLNFKPESDAALQPPPLLKPKLPLKPRLPLLPKAH